MTGIVAGQYFLTTERLGFRTWRPDDVHLAVGLWGDPQVAGFIYAGGPPARAAIEERLAREMTMQAEHGFQYWPIFMLADGAHVGCCGLRPYRPEAGILELGVHIRPVFWRRGFAFEAAKAVIAYAFDRLGARGLFAGHNPANNASRQLVLKLGFRYTHDELYPPTGLQHPSYLLMREV
jgi:RimJ/RimL family protein N-acetyltransferase